MIEPRNSVFALKDWLQLLLAIGGVVSLALGFFAWMIPADIKALPDDVKDIKVQLAVINGASVPQVVEFLGGGVIFDAKARPGGRVTVTYVLRRNIDCETTIRVRFWDFMSSTLILGPDIPAVRSPVSKSFTAFSIGVRIPLDLPPGKYGYFPEIIPRDCGVYRAIVPPMSDMFEVKG